MATIDVNNRDSLVEYAYESLRKLIQTATFPPGSKLSTIEISSMLNISRTPVVSALNRLVLVRESLFLNSQAKKSVI